MSDDVFFFFFIHFLLNTYNRSCRKYEHNFEQPKRVYAGVENMGKQMIIFSKCMHVYVHYVSFINKGSINYEKIVRIFTCLTRPCAGLRTRGGGRREEKPLLF